MNTIIKRITYSCAIAILIVFNFNISILESSDKSTTLISLNTAKAQEAEYAGWDNFWQGQGFYKNEREIEQPCPEESKDSGKVCIEYNNVGVCIEYEQSQSGTSGRTDIRCGSGSENCTPVNC